jgi:type I restriction enzyme S subunit
MTPDGFLYVTSKNIRPFRLDLGERLYISEEDHKEIWSRCDVQLGDVLLTKDGANTGNAAINPMVEPFSLLSSVALIRPTPGLLDAGFLCQYLNSEPGRRRTTAAMDGLAIRRLTIKKIRDLDVPLPPLPEQRKIAAILSSIDDTIEHARILISHLATLRTTLIRALVAGDGDVAGSQRVTLEEAATLQRGFDLPAQIRQAGPYPVMASNGSVGFHSEFQARGPGVVTGRSGTIGKVFFLERDFWPLNTTLFVKDFHGNDPKFIAYVLENLCLDRFVAATGVPSLNRNFIHPLPVWIPPLEEQVRIAARISSSDDALRSNRQYIGELHQVKAGLLQALLPGEVRVNPDEAVA